jgi:hypothetical protein
VRSPNREEIKVMRSRWVGAAVLVAAGSLLGGTAVADAAAPVDLVGSEVCDLVSADEVGTALDTRITRTTPSDSGTPQCSYEYEGSDGVRTNVVVAVSRTQDDLGGRTGPKAFKYAVRLNKMYGGKGAKYSTVPGVGAKATFAVGRLTSNLIVMTDDGRVLTVAGGGLDRAAAAAIAKAAAARLR